MSAMTLKTLVEKLNTPSKTSLEAAAGNCHSRSHFTVEIEHWLLAMLESETGDLSVILSAFDTNPERLKAELLHSLEQKKTGNTTAPSLSPHIVSLMRESWLNCTIEFGDNQIRSAYLLYTMLSDDTLSSLVLRHAKQLERIDPAQLLPNWPELQQQSDEGGKHSTPVETGTTKGISKTPSLDQFTQDLTQQAKEGKIDPILCRDDEIRQMIDILTRRRQNNPILTGEAGVGKTAVVEGLALRIAQKDVPVKLQNVSIRSLDLALLQAGAGMKGEFENRLKSLIKEIRESATPIILFIDEAHTMIGSGGTAGQNDAANLLKPALARGELRTIAATTWAEYKKFFEKDAALARRFQVVKVEEPSEAQAIIMMRGLLPVMEKHHNVSITDHALQAAVSLSNRYINGRQLPDKAVGLLDTAAARVAMSQAATPGAVEQQQRLKEQLNAEIATLEKEEKLGVNHEARLAELFAQSEQAEQELEQLQRRWNEEQELIKRACEIQQQLNSPEEADTAEIEQLLSELNSIKATLKESKQPMVHWLVDEQLVAEVVSDWTGIPLGRMQSDEIHTVLNLTAQMEKRVIGQSHALDLIAKTVQISRAQLGDEKRPVGVFMLAGPSGVGKTETALTLAELVYGSEENVTIINMSEFKEEHKVSLLVGSPPGYVGYGEGGILTEAVRRKPYSVILLDEMEKAHPGVQDIFFQVFDKGMLKDGEGRDIDFKNTIIIMTSNVGTDTTMQLFADKATAPSITGLGKALKDDLLAAYKPAFLGRINVIPYIPLDEEMLTQITELQLNRVGKRLTQHYKAQFNYSDAVVDAIVSRCTDADSGARNIHNILQNEVLPELSVQLLENMADNITPSAVSLDHNGDEFCYQIIETKTEEASQDTDCTNANTQSELCEA